MANNTPAWHAAFEQKDLTKLDELIAPDACFHSPVVHTPQEGKKLTKFYLSTAFMVLGNEHFEYVRELVDGDQTVLEFKTVLQGIEINGVDMIRWNADGQIEDFKVMLRPLKAVNLVHQMMGAAMQASQKK